MSYKYFIFIILVCPIIVVSSFLSSAIAQQCTDNDNDGFAVEGGLCGVPDCNDFDATVYPGAKRICDGQDNDCDGYQDFFTDMDNDGDGIPLCGGDCDDNNSNRFPGNKEGPWLDSTCSDGIDNDCDNRVDSYDVQCRKQCRDIDGDGYGNPGSEDCPNGSVTDCNDNDANINPGAIDSTCNNIDNNCDGIVDDAYVMTISDCGLGICSSTGVLKCLDGMEIDSCIPGLEQTEGPLDDSTCYDGLDNNCDGETDLNDTNCILPCLDNDGDGYGYPGNPVCPNGPVVDCNDNDPDINPDHIVYCDNTINDCYSYAALTWNAPVTNMDGSDLHDLAGYRIYYGETSDTMEHLIDVGNNTCYIISNLTSQDWCFAVTAYDVLGNESTISDEVCKFID